MAPDHRVVTNDIERGNLARFIMNKPMPFTVTIAEGKHRTNPQNKLQRKWMTEISEQLGDCTPEDVRGECKLRFGVPILRAENEAFRVSYDRVVKPLPYETKVELMKEPISLPVTSMMTTKQKTAYLDAIHRHYSAQGIVLTDPDPMGLNQIKRAS